MAIRLHILTPLTRPWHLPRIAHYLFGGETEAHPFEVRWHICQQGPEPDPGGVNKINECLDMIKDGWFVTWCDDTVHNPATLRRLSEVIEGQPLASFQDGLNFCRKPMLYYLSFHRPGDV